MRKKDFTEKQIKKIIRLYTEESIGTPSIGDIFGISKRSINQILRENNVEIYSSGRRYIGGKRASDKRYREKNKEKQQQYMENYYPKYYNENKNKIKEYHKEYRDNNSEKEKLRHKEYREKNKNRRNELHKERMGNDSLYKLKHNIRSLIKQGLKSKKYVKNSKTQEILGCSFEEFKLHIESLWEPWMNWNNCGNPKDGIIEPNKTWDIDHIVPTSSAITEEELLKLNHFTNLQPLCSHYNRFIKRNL